MITIYKYPFSVAGRRVTINLPADAKILKVEVQAGPMYQPCLWAWVDTVREISPRNFLIFGTGHDMDRGEFRVGSHISTFQQAGFVWHMFEDLSDTGRAG